MDTGPAWGFTPKHIKLQYKIIILFLSSFILPIIIFGAFLLLSFERILEANLYNHQEAALFQFKESFDKYLIDLDRIARTFSYDNSFSKDLSKTIADFSSFADFELHLKGIQHRLLENISEEKRISSIFLFTGRDRIISTDAGLEDNLLRYTAGRDWFESILSGNELSLLIRADGIANPSGGGRHYLLFATFVKITRLKEKTIDNGVVVFLLDNGFLDSMIKNLQRSLDKLFLFDVDGNLIYSNNKEIAYKILPANLAEKLKTDNRGRHGYLDSEGIKNLVSFATSRFDLIKILGSSTNSLIKNEITLLTRDTFLFLLFLILLFILFILLFSRSISLPINTMETAMKKLEASHFNLPLELPKKYKSGLLSPYFDYLIHILNSMILNINEHHKKEKEQQLLIMQSQINPHFVNNTLNTIRMMAIAKGEEELAEAIRKLIHLLQSSIKIGQFFIPISEEITQIKNYVSLQQMRYNNSFTVDYDIDVEVYPCNTIKFILQPLVENSIFHGFGSFDGNGELLVRIKLSGSGIIYTVKDNGIGMDTLTISRLLDARSDTVSGREIGIINVNSRLKEIFGPLCGLSIESVANMGTTVSYTIPAALHEEKEPNENSHR